jgi:hypothetical protein
MMERLRVEPTPRLTLDDKALQSETLLSVAGAHALTLSTAIGELGATLHSSYLGHPGTDTIASHLALTREPHAFAKVHDHDALPVAYARRRCLYDHLHELQTLLEDAGHRDLKIDVLDQALALVDR